MSQESNSPKSFIATEALAVFRRVKLTASSGTHVEYADQADADDFVGVVKQAADADAHVAVELKNAGGTRKCVASEAIAAGAAIYAADDGKVADTVSGAQIGTALEAATADDAIIECLLS